MGYLVLGAGAMGRAVALDLAKGEGTELVTVADADEVTLEHALGLMGPSRATTMVLDVTDDEAVVGAMEAHDVAVSCVPYRFNHALTVSAIEAGCHLCDLGGNNDIVRKQLCLDARARRAGVTVVPDCGLAPGLSTVLVADAMGRLDRVSEVHIRVGGLPVDPRPPLDYQVVFDPAGLVNEYKETPIVIRDGRVQAVEPLGDLEDIEFPEPFGTLEAFNTSGGTSTLPQTLLGKVDALDYKTIRYRGHRDKVKVLMELGLFDDPPVTLGEVQVSPRELTEALLRERLSFGGEDAVLLRVWAEGEMEGRDRTVTYTIIDRSDEGTGLTAMQRTTAFPASIIARMLASGDIDERGVVTQEHVVPTSRFIEEMELRGVTVDIECL